MTNGRRRATTLRAITGLLAGALAGLSWSLPLQAQSSRAEEHEQRQAEKAAQVTEYKPVFAERIVEQIVRIGLLGPPVGVYPFVGSVYSGGGLAAGPGLRLPYSDTGVLSAQAGWSIRNYKLVNVSLKLPELADGHLHLSVDGRYLDAPQVSFYGLGPGSSQEAQSSYGYEPRTVGATALVTGGGFSVGGGFDLVAIKTGEGTGRFPSIETRFAPAEAPGLGLDPTYEVPRAFAQFDWRESPGYTTRGGLYRIAWADYRERDGAPFDFQRVDVDLQQFVPVVRANWVLAFRALATVTETDSGHAVPFFMLPTLGSGTELRAYENFRFRDRHRLLLIGEYRWRPSRFLDMALFYEAGKVASRRSDLDLDGLKRSYGIGARFHAPHATALRFELARGDEGLRFIIGAGPVF